MKYTGEQTQPDLVKRDEVLIIDDKYRLHFVSCEKSDVGVLTLDKNDDGVPNTVYEWEMGWTLANRWSYFMHYVLTLQDVELLFEYRGLADIVDLVDAYLNALKIAVTIEWPKETHEIKSFNHSV